MLFIYSQTSGVVCESLSLSAASRVERAGTGLAFCFGPLKSVVDQGFVLVDQQRLKNPIDYPIGTRVGSYKVT